MAEIRFRKIQELLGKDLAEDQELCYEKGIIEALGIEEKLSSDATEIILGLSESVSDDMEIAFAYDSEVLYARIYDGERYVFPLPFMLTDKADAVGACITLAEYSVREMIPLIITDVPREELEFLSSVFLHMDAATYEDDDDTFFVKVNNECDMLEYVPTVQLDGITLDALCEADKERYAVLCRDRELNKFWGYDADVDNPDKDAQFYLDVVTRELDEGIALTLAIREGGVLVGEATVYGFDYRGGASIAVRVLRECHSRGIGTRATRALIKVAKDMGLKHLNAEILNENVGSIKMTSKLMELVKQTESKHIFALSL